MNSDSGRIGAAARRSAGTTNTTNAIVATARPSTGGEAQPQSAPNDAVSTSPVAAAAISSAPRWSMRPADR
ncbi:hypothetical protein [Lentzea guizhouensis]|uniref:hypothetical protein n=1 Tax=Lentzea guizhouensis TaxID=1586287 RepID=UPI001F46E266|nr:hypothetical protein [Lentzea guizhouensis]